MPIAITSRELFKSYGKALDLPGLPLNYKYDKNKPEKNWVDTWLSTNPSFIGLKTLTSPQGASCVVVYGSRFVTYPFGLQHINGKPAIDNYIVSREEAVMFNMLRGDEGTASTGSSVAKFDGFPIDRPLYEGESIGRLTPMSPEQILTQEDTLAANIRLEDVYNKLLVLEEMIKQLLMRG